MIPFDFSYVRPDTLTEALNEKAACEKAVYFSGGTEIISMARMHAIAPEKVIDIKCIKECRVHTVANGQLCLGAALTLNELMQKNLFPLLTKTVSRIADHTNQCKITLGGNLSGTIPYREASLPLLIADATALLATDDGAIPVLPLVDRKSEMLLAVHVPQQAAKWPYYHYKAVRQEKIDYPLFTLVAALDDRLSIRIAISGLTAAPIRSAEMENALNLGGIDAAIAAIREPIIDDMLGSAAYRLFRLKWALTDAVAALKGAMPC